MSNTVKKTISLSADLAAEIKKIALIEEKTLSSVVQEALKNYRRSRSKNDFYQLQGYWSNQAKSLGILSEKDLNRYLEK